jgi:5-bromo-4-chloroindolyl phosphate hydrolysis protein
MKNGPIYSAVLGAATTMICLGLEFALLPAVVVGVVAYAAGNMIFSTGNTNNGLEEMTNTMKFTSDGVNESKLDSVLAKAAKDNAQIYFMINKIDDPNVVRRIRSLHDIVAKIIAAVKKSPKKLKQADKFFSYYLPTTVSFLHKYDEIENQRIGTEEMKEFMEKTEAMLEKIEVAFKSQLNNLYQSDMMDTNAEMKLFDSMLKSDGISGEQDFKI